MYECVELFLYNLQCVGFHHIVCNTLSNLQYDTFYKKSAQSFFLSQFGRNHRFSQASGQNNDKLSQIACVSNFTERLYYNTYRNESTLSRQVFSLK